MPNQEGFGVSDLPYGDANKRFMLFSPTAEAAAHAKSIMPKPEDLKAIEADIARIQSLRF